MTVWNERLRWNSIIHTKDGNVQYNASYSKPRSYVYGAWGEVVKATYSRVYFVNTQKERYFAQGPNFQKHYLSPTIYHYDLDSKLLAEDGVMSPSGSYREYIYLGSTPIALLADNIRGYTRNGKKDYDGSYKYDFAKFQSYDGVFYIYADHLGSPYLVTSNNTGEEVWRRHDFKSGASPFGARKTSDKKDLHSGIITMPLRFPGQYHDSKTGDNYNQHRYYDPELGRYLQSDPLSIQGGFNTYHYAHNNPMTYTDPTGEFVPLIFAAGAMLYSAAEIAMSAYDIYDTGKTLLDPCVGNGAKIRGVGLLAAGFFLPGAGYSKLDDVVEGVAKGGGKIPWGSWSDYKKVNVDGQDYAQVGNRLYSEHAVNRMQPGRRRHSSQGQTGGLPEIHLSGTRADHGRGVAPQYVEDVISSSKPVLQQNGNLSFTSGSLQVITNQQGAVVTIITH